MKAAHFALALALGVTLHAPAFAQLVQFAHDDDQWEHDRHPAYAGDGWLESQGGSPPVAFPSQGVDLRSWIPVGDLDPAATSANDIWGYVSPLGREYALIGISNGTAFVEITDPANAQLVEMISGPTSSWRDIKTYGETAYAVSEGGGGIQVMDLSQIDTGVVSLVSTVTTGGRLATHDVAVNTESGMLYRAGGGRKQPGPGASHLQPRQPESAGFRRRVERPLLSRCPGRDLDRGSLRRGRGRVLLCERHVRVRKPRNRDSRCERPAERHDDRFDQSRRGAHF